MFDAEVTVEDGSVEDWLDAISDTAQPNSRPVIQKNRCYLSGAD